MLRIQNSFLSSRKPLTVSGCIHASEMNFDKGPMATVSQVVFNLLVFVAIKNHKF